VISNFDSDGKCLTCKGTGKLPLFTSLANCDVCDARGFSLKQPLSDKQKQKLICDYIKTPEGRRKLSGAMTQSIGTCRDHNAVSRKTFQDDAIAV